MLIPILKIKSNKKTKSMASTSLSHSSPLFTGRKFAVNEPNRVPSRVQFRKSRVSASASCSYTAERPISPISSPDSLYEVLGIQIGANCQEIKAAYMRLARIVHPDVAAKTEGITASLLRSMKRILHFLILNNNRGEIDKARRKKMMGELVGCDGV